MDGAGTAAFGARPAGARSPHEKLMAAALAEAELGRGRTHPNPVVGAVIVRDGKVIARGHHLRAGGPHAEVVALAGAGERARGADLYVTLEPCNHFGRTPPCTEALLAAGIRRVFFGSDDPNPSVRGHGARRLRAAGVEVVAGIAKDRCDASNEHWFKFITGGTPWVSLKAAITLDGKLATAEGDSRWVSGPESRRLVHLWRDRLDAVLIGVGTAIADDPQLTVRLSAPRSGARRAKGRPEPRDPVRVVVDSRARLPPRAAMLRQRSSAPTWVAVTRRAPEARIAALERAGAAILRCRAQRDGRVDLRDLLRRLALKGITSVLVEGGAAIHGAFLSQGLWDDLSLFVAPRVAGAGALSWAGFSGPPSMKQALALGPLQARTVGGDLLLTSRRRGPSPRKPRRR
jgi:diaminohydroxyphosphoribosylaminopyrimidine deaminase/5-amino-6-(5-phosphoribosylamino)uracil reductase